MKDIAELNPHNFTTNPNIDKNLQTLFQRVMELQDAFGSNFIVTSGLRSEGLQAELIAAGKTNAKFSKHLSGAAVDLKDSKKTLAKFIKENEAVLKSIGLYAEHPDYTNGWVHVQCLQPKSGKTIFIP